MDRFIETCRGVVQSWECDHLGHMNIQFYVGKLSEAAWQMMDQIGLGPTVQREQRLALPSVRHEIDYRRELKAGDLVVVESAVRAIGDKSLTIEYRLLNGETGDLACRARVIAVCMDLETRQGRPLPAEVRERAAALLIPDEKAAEQR